MLGHGDHGGEPLGGQAGGLVVAALLEQVDQEAARDLEIAGALGAFPPRELDLPLLRGGHGLRPQSAQELAVTPRGERAVEQADHLGEQGGVRPGGDRGRQQARRHLGVAQPVLIERQAVAAVELERRGRRDSAGEGLHGIREAAQGIEEMAAEVVEAELAGGLRVGGELLLGAGERLGRPAGELVLDELRPRIRDSDGEGESEGAEHRRSGAGEAAPPRHSEL